MPTEGRRSGEYYPRATGAGTPAIQRSLDIEEYTSEVIDATPPTVPSYVVASSAKQCSTEPFRFVKGENRLGTLFPELFGPTVKNPTNFLYFDKDCLPFLISSVAESNKRDSMLSYIKNIMFLELSHKPGEPFRNTIPVIGYTSITGKSDIDFLVRALGIFRATGTRQGGIGFVDSTIDTFLPEAITGTNPHEVKAAKEKLQTVLQTLPRIPERASLEQITFNEIFKIAHITETVFMIVFTDLYCRIQYIENQILTINRSVALLSASTTLLTAGSSAQERKEAKDTINRGTNPAEKEDDKTYKELQKNIKNYLCIPVKILHEEPLHPVNAHFESQEYYRYNLNLQLPKYEFDDTRETVQATARFENKEFFSKTCELMKALFGFTFEGEELTLPKLHFKNIRLDMTKSSIVFTTKKSKITEYFEDFRELDAEGQRRSAPKSYTYVPKDYGISKFGTQLVTLSKKEGITVTKYADSFKPFFLEALGIESVDEAKKMLKFYFKSWDNAYTKSELLLIHQMAYIEQTEKRSGFFGLRTTTTYTKESAPARAHVYNIDLYTQFFSNTLIPKTIIPQLQESDVIYAKLAAYAYDVVPKRTVQYKDRIAYYINIWQSRPTIRSISAPQPSTNIRESATLIDTFKVGMQKDKYAFSPYDFMDSLGVENIRFYYEKPAGFKEAMQAFSQRRDTPSSSKVKKLEAEKTTKEENIKKLRAEANEFKRKIQILEERVSKVGKVQSENLGSKISSLGEEQDELESELEKVEREVAILTSKGKDTKALEKRKNQIEARLSEIDSEMDKALQNDKALNKGVKAEKHEKQEEIKQLKAKLKRAEDGIAFLESKVPIVERLIREAKEEAEEEIKNEFLDYVKANPFRLIIAYRGTDFKGQTQRDLFTADVLLSVGKEESDPRFTIVNRIRANMRIFYKLVRNEALNDVPESYKELFMKHMRLVVYATGHSLGGTLAIVSTYASYKTPLPEYMRGLVSPIILSVGFNSGMGPRITEKMYRLPANSFRIYTSEGDAISLCARYFKDNFVYNKKNIISTPCIHSLSYEPKYIIMNHGMTNFLGITEFCKDAGIAEITDESIAALRGYDKIIVYGKGVDTESPPRLTDKDIYQRIKIDLAGGWITRLREDRREPRTGGSYRITRRNRVRNGTRKH